MKQGFLTRDSMVKKILTIFFMLFFCAGYLFADEFVIPSPPDGKKIKDVEMPLAGSAIEGHTYSTSLSCKDAALYYSDIFDKEGFKPVSDRVPEPGAEVLTFSKGNQTCYVRVEADKAGALVSLASYVNPNGSGPPDIKKMTWKDMLNMLPQEDEPGADLDIIPRPPNSVRIMNRISSNMAMLEYLTKAPLDKVKDFYLTAMSAYQWKNIGADNVKDSFDRLGKQGQAFNSKIEQASVLDMPMSKLMKDAVKLTFEGPKGKADIMLMNTNPDSGQDSNVIVTIAYSEKKEIYEKGK
jgi:hypothetical protein